MANETTKALLKTQNESLKKSKDLYNKFTKSILALSLIAFVLNILLLLFVPFIQTEGGSISFFKLEESFSIKYIDKFDLDTLSFVHTILLAVSIIGAIAVIVLKALKVKANIYTLINNAVSVINTIGFLGLYLMHSLTLIKMYPGAGADTVAYVWFAAFFVNAAYMFVSLMIPSIKKNIIKLEGTIKGLEKDLAE